VKRFSKPAGTLAVEVPDQPDDASAIDHVRWLSQMQADLAQSLGGVMLQGARPVAIGSAPGGSQRPLSSPGRLVGWSVHETSGTGSAVLRIWDGRETNTRLVAILSVPAGQAVDNVWISPGVSITDALYVEILSGGGLSTTVEGVLYLGAAD
jgi:hypothetical protein